MEDLISGYRRFRAGMWSREQQRFEELGRDGQQPRTLVIACSDSRTDPQMVFNARPGELFVIRNVANLVPPYGPDSHYHGTSAALEFGVRELKIQHIVVMGHAMCGGIGALLRGGPAKGNDFVGTWMHIADPARVRALEVPEEQRQRVCEHESLRLSLENLMTFPWISEQVTQGKLALHGCFFDIRSGILEMLGADGTFHPIAAADV